LDYFQKIIHNTDVDIMLHVTPTRSEIETTFGKTHRYEIHDLEQICALPRVIGFKEASGDKEHSREIWKSLGKSTDIIVAGAASETFLEACVHGATGFFTGIESIFPRLGQEVYKRILDNDVSEAESMVTQMSDLLHACKKLGWHAASKYCLFNLGIMGLDERPPMTPIPEHQQKILQPKIAKLKLVGEQYD
jgi:dihydrodipicolinate synthase/N-acetylneuraminate lyase